MTIRVPKIGPRSNERRHWLVASAGLAAGLVIRPAATVPSDLAADLAAFAGGRELHPGRVTVDIPRLVDNGNSVPVTVTVESPMTPTDHVSAIAIFSERNPERDVARFRLGPRAGRAVVTTRIRLAASQKLVAVAHLSDGTFHSQAVDVLVALAACIDGEN